jgi:hypothetical protein
MVRWWNDIDKKTEVLRKKPVPMPLYPPQIVYGLARDQIRASMVGSQQVNT